MLKTSPNWRFNAVTFLDCIIKRVIVTAFFVNFPFKAPKIQQVFKAPPA